MRDIVHVYYKDPDYLTYPKILTEDEQARLDSLYVGEYLHLEIDLSSGHVEIVGHD